MSDREPAGGRSSGEELRVVLYEWMRKVPPVIDGWKVVSMKRTGDVTIEVEMEPRDSVERVFGSEEVRRVRRHEDAVREFFGVLRPVTPADE